MTDEWWPTGRTIEPAGSAIPSIGMTVGGRAVRRSPRVNATAIGSVESFSISTTVIPPPSATDHVRCTGVAGGDPQPGLEHRGARRCGRWRTEDSSAGECHRSSAATCQSSVGDPSHGSIAPDCVTVARHRRPTTPVVAAPAGADSTGASSLGALRVAACVSGCSACSLALVLLAAAHQRTERLRRGPAAVAHRHHLLGDRHVDTVALGEVEHARRALHALGDHVGVGEHLLDPSCPGRAAARPGCCGSAWTSRWRSGRRCRRARRTSSAAPPIAMPRRVISARPRLISVARVLSPKPIPSAMPAAIAMMFLTTPATSQPTTSSLV